MTGVLSPSPISHKITSIFSLNYFSPTFFSPISHLPSPSPSPPVLAISAPSCDDDVSSNAEFYTVFFIISFSFFPLCLHCLYNIVSHSFIYNGTLNVYVVVFQLTLTNRSDCCNLYEQLRFVEVYVKTTKYCDLVNSIIWI